MFVGCSEAGSVTRGPTFGLVHLHPHFVIKITISIIVMYFLHFENCTDDLKVLEFATDLFV